VISKTKAFSLCTIDEHAGRDYFNPEELKQWRFVVAPFILQFLNALGISQPSITENITGLLWDLGSQEINGKRYHLFFTINIDNIEKDKRSIITSLPNTVVFYLGTAHTALPDGVLLVPVFSLINEITNKGLVLLRNGVDSYFPKQVVVDENDDLQLDRHIVLAAKRNLLLLDKRRGGGFKQEVKISPQAVRLLAYFYQIRHYDLNSRTLRELADMLANKSKVSISNRIKEIATICKDNGIKSLLHKYSNDKWGLNPQLECCK
jgi:hypothetical protein